MNSEYLFLKLIIACLSLICTSCIQAVNEQACLLSDRLIFKDPDSIKVIANLGDRGAPSLTKGAFWIRYSAANSYGGRGSQNMACAKDTEGKWKRSRAVESEAFGRVYVYYLRQVAKTMEAEVDAKRLCADQKCRDAISYGRKYLTAEAAEAAAADMANERIFDSPEPLGLVASAEFDSPRLDHGKTR